MSEPTLYLTPELKEAFENSYKEISLRVFQRETKKYIQTREHIESLSIKKVGKSAFRWDEDKGWVDADWSTLPVRNIRFSGREEVAFTKFNFYK